MPSLKAFQNRYRYVRYSKLNEHNNPATLRRLVTEKNYDPQLDDDKFFLLASAS
jgi:hypothetical protein